MRSQSMPIKTIVLTIIILIVLAAVIIFFMSMKGNLSISTNKSVEIAQNLTDKATST